MRPRKSDRHLPARLYHKHGAYYYVHQNKWERLSESYPEALSLYAERINPSPVGGMTDLIDRAFLDMQTKPRPSTGKMLAKNTLDQYKIAANRLKVVFVEFSPEQVQPRHIAQLKNEMAATPNMANRCLSFLRCVFDYALELQEIDSNPCIGIKRLGEKKRDVYMSDDAFAAIREHCPPWLAALLDISYLTAQRISDVLSIDRSDVTEDGVYFKQQKTDAKVLVRMTPDLRDAIDRATACNNTQKTHPTLLLWNRKGKPRDYGTVKDTFNTAKEKAGVTGVTIHDYRAKSLTDAKLQGHNATELAGHSSERMTDRYIRLRVPVKATPPSMPKNSKKPV